jgi:hypothetical protein
MRAEVAARAQDLVDTSVTVDPFLTIDPVFLSQNPGFSLVFSDSVANSPPQSGVPETATWAMLLAGFGGIGCVLRQRQRRVAVA